MKPGTIAALFVLGAALFVLAITLMFSANEPETKPLPAPPAGYEYCATADGRSVYFCPKD